MHNKFYYLLVFLVTFYYRKFPEVKIMVKCPHHVHTTSSPPGPPPPTPESLRLRVLWDCQPLTGKGAGTKSC